MNNASKVSRTTVRTITLEKHFATPAFLNGPGARINQGAEEGEDASELRCEVPRPGRFL